MYLELVAFTKLCMIDQQWKATYNGGDHIHQGGTVVEHINNQQ